MSDVEQWRAIVVVLTVLGFGVTVWGLVSVYLGARDEHAKAGTRIELMRSLHERELAELAEVERSAGDHQARADRAAAVHKRFEDLYADNQLVRPSYENMVYLALHESQRLLGVVLSESRGDLLLAGVGLLVSTGASVWSLFL